MTLSSPQDPVVTPEQRAVMIDIMLVMMIMVLVMIMMMIMTIIMMMMMITSSDLALSADPGVGEEQSGDQVEPFGAARPEIGDPDLRCTHHMLPLAPR